MNRLRVSIRGPGARVRQELVPVVDGAVIGDDERSAALFPGARMELRQVDGGWTLGGHPLMIGRPLAFRLGELEVRVEPEALAHAGAGGWTWVDVRVLVLLLGALLALASLGAALRARL